MTADPKAIEPVDIHVGTMIRRRRRYIDMGQDQLGQSIGVSAQQVQKYETAESRITASKLFKVAKALGVPVAFFFSEIDDQEPDTFSSEPDARIYAFLQSSDGQELASVFPQIEDTHVRKNFLGLARAMAKASRTGPLIQT